MWLYSSGDSTRDLILDFVGETLPRLQEESSERDHSILPGSAKAERLLRWLFRRRHEQLDRIDDGDDLFAVGPDRFFYPLEPGREGLIRGEHLTQMGEPVQYEKSQPSVG